ncbi:VIR protein [Plasmodium vivax]|uniref:VIR protein n=1 Tax=Plasmodium vivax TaxID=5855 RepID=A0A1G4HG14_PLAVI|nr:VIR protein [Plasmodium vivax]
MTPSQEPECAKNDKDLPATKFDNEFRECAKLDTLEDAVFSNGNTDFYKGHKNFMSNLIHCYTKQTLNFDTKLHEKRCRDLNYYVDFAIDLVSKLEIRSIRSTKQLREQLVDKIKSDINQLFNATAKLNCSRTVKDYSWETSMRKELDDYCENRDHLVSCISNGSNKCEKLKKLVETNFKKFLSNKCLISNYENGSNPFDIHENCTLYDIKKTFSYDTCNNFNIQYDIKDIPPCPSEDLSIWDKFLELINPYISYITNISDIPPYVQYICFGVLGIFIFSLILFKCTPLGNACCRRKSKNRKKYNFDEEEVLYNNSFYGQPMQAPMMPYQIPYYPLQNTMPPGNMNYYLYTGYQNNIAQ